MEMFLLMMHVADDVWVALNIFTMGTWGVKIPQNQKEAKTERREKGTRKQNDERMNVVKFQAYYCSHFCLYFALGNSKGWSYSVRNVVALYCGDLTLLAPGKNRHPGHGELNPLEFCAQCLWAKGAKLDFLISALNLDIHESRVWLKGLFAYLHTSLTLLTSPRPGFLPWTYREATTEVMYKVN